MFGADGKEREVEFTEFLGDNDITEKISGHLRLFPICGQLRIQSPDIIPLY